MKKDKDTLATAKPASAAEAARALEGKPGDQAKVKKPKEMDEGVAKEAKDYT